MAARSVGPDPSSYANVDKISTTHIDLDWTVDFEAKVIRGAATLRCTVLAAVGECVLDSRGLTVTDVEVDGVKTTWSVETGSDALGDPIVVALPEAAQVVDRAFDLRVTYSTAPEASALQWLAPEATAGKVHPYLFTQCQAIHARSLLPCADSPSQKVTYAAAVTVPAHLEVVMSAVRQEGAAGEESKADGAAAASSGETRVVRYRQEQGIPSYLIAMAVGNLVSREIGPRSKCWSEPETVDAGAYEFADTEKFLSIAEELLTPYAWGVYDVLLLPPSFPYGGMENPCLTFVTPTLLAGDRSLADVICHEIAHSWTGNLVTSRYWSDFWLNEGFTMLVQRKVMMRILGAPFFDFDGAKGLHDLREDLAHFGAENPLTALRPAIDGIDPDDAFSSVPYEKGFSFLVYLQNTVGGHEAMDGFLKAYITKFAGKSITSDDFRAFFCEHFSEVDLAAVDWETWFSTPGMPPCELPYDTSMRDACDALAAKWLECQGAGIGAESFEALNVHQRIAFLDQLLTLTATDDTGASPGARLSHDALEKLDAVYGLGKSGNSEIRFRWLTLGLRHGYGKVVDNTVQFLAEQGRMKFVRPLYRSLAEASIAGSDTTEIARSTFARLRPSYHPIAAKMIASDLTRDA